jgi:hypothetical protein
MDLVSIDLREIQNGRELKRLFRDNGYSFTLKPSIVFDEFKNKKGAIILICDKESLMIIGYYGPYMAFYWEDQFAAWVKRGAHLIGFKHVTELKKEKVIDFNKFSLDVITEKIDREGVEAIPFEKINKSKIESLANDILDKIGRVGYDGLSEPERLLLKRISLNSNF